MYYGGTSSSGSITDAQTVYFGDIAGVAFTTTDSVFVNRFYSPIAGTINSIYVYFNSTTAGSNESWSAYLRVNGTTDTLIQTLSSTSQPRIWSNTSLGVSISAGDYFLIKLVNPTWATNPSTAVSFKCVIYLDY